MQRIKACTFALRQGMSAFFLAATVTGLSGWLAPGLMAAERTSAIPQDPSRLLVVDCLLPGQVRKLGGQMTYLSPRRPIKTNASDCEIRGGEYVTYDRANYATALTVWMPQAEAGDAEAQTYVGEIFEKGLGRAPDYAIAAQWYQKAAAQNYTRAQMNLAFLYEQGMGVTKDPVKALNLYRQASGISDDSLTYVSEVVAVKSEMQGRIDDLTDQLEQQNATAAKLQEQLDASQQDLAAQSEQLARARGDARSLRQQVADLKAQAPTDPERVAQLQKLEQELQQRESRVGEQERSVANLQADAASKQVRLTEELAAAADRDEALRAELAQTTQQNTALQQQLAAAQRRLTDTEKQAARMRAEVATQRAALATDRVALSQQPAAGVDAAQRQKMQAEIDARERKLAEQQVQIDALLARQRDYTAELTRLKAEQATQRASSGQQGAQLASTQRQLAESQKQVSQLTAQLETERAKAATDRRALEQKPAPKSDIERAERQQMQAALAAREARIAEQQQQIEALRAQQRSYDAEVARLKTQQQQAGAAQGQQQALVASTRSELASTRLQLQETEKRVADLSAQLQSERQRLTVEKEQLNRRATSAAGAQQAEINRLRQTLVAREADLARQQTLISSLQAESQLYKRKIQDLQAQPSVERVAMRSAGGQPINTALAARNVPKELRRGTYHALIIGNNKYQNMPNLDTAVNDALALDGVLREKYGFKTRVLVDATRADIVQALHDYTKSLKADDSLLIYYAGHGELDRQNAQGYWLPVDADRNNISEWIPGSVISAQINLMPARHVMVVADSCYQGIMTRSTGVGFPGVSGDEAQIRRLTNLAKLPSRTVLTSGGEQPVLDSGGGTHSIFALVLLRVLQSNDRVLEGGSLYNAVFDDVRKAAARLKQEQSPRYDVLADAGHRNGEFLFIPLG